MEDPARGQAELNCLDAVTRVFGLAIFLYFSATPPRTGGCAAAAVEATSSNRMLQLASLRLVTIVAPEVGDLLKGEHRHERKTTDFVDAACVTHLAFVRAGKFQGLLLLFGGSEVRTRSH